MSNDDVSVSGYWRCGPPVWFCTCDINSGSGRWVQSLTCTQSDHSDHMELITILSCLSLAQADILKEDVGKARDVMGFPFERLEAGGGVEVVGDDDDLLAEVVEVPVVEGEEDVRCVGKVKLVEETEWDEVVTCNHSYDQRCHQTFVTRSDTGLDQPKTEMF